MTFAQWLGSVLTFTALNAIAIYLGRKWLGSWIDIRFARRLERFKNEQAKDLEKLRQQLTSITNRLSRIHESDFGILMEAWKKLQEARGRIHALIAAGRNLPPFESMSLEYRNEYIEGLKWPRSEKDQLLKADSLKEVKEIYVRLLRQHQRGEASQAHHEFHNFIIDNEPLIGAELSVKLMAIADTMFKTLIQEEIMEQARQLEQPTFPKYEEWVVLNPLVTEVRDLIRKRLLETPF